MKNIKILNFYIYLLLLINVFNFAYSEIRIIVKVKDNIITNHDIKKEASYLKILNTSLNSLDNDQVNELAKKSIINEIIKKEEISKLIDIEKEDIEINTTLNNLLKNLKIDNIENFKDLLEERNTYNLEIIKNKIKIETLWNFLIYEKFKNQIKIDEKKFLAKLKDFENQDSKEYLLSEIVFQKKNNQSISELIKEINNSIDKIGFENTANIYSISDSAKLGGVVGWVSQNNLIPPIVNELKVINKGEYTKALKVNNNFIILKINEIKVSKIKINKDIELKRMIENEKNRQLTKFSRIYFEKSYKNYFIDEE